MPTLVNIRLLLEEPLSKLLVRMSLDRESLADREDLEEKREVVTVVMLSDALV